MKKIIALLFLFSAATFLMYFLWFRNIHREAVGAVPSFINAEKSFEENKIYPSPIGIGYLRSQKIESDAPVIEEELTDGSNYKRYIASYASEGNKVYGLLTVPKETPPDKGFPAIVFNHGYIPPTQYVTTQNYASYVDYLAKNGFVVFKIDFRGNGRSEGDPSGSYCCLERLVLNLN